MFASLRWGLVYQGNTNKWWINLRISLILSHYLLLYPWGSWRCYRFIALFKGSWGLLEPTPVVSLDEGRAHPERVASSSQGPYWWQRPPRKAPPAHQKQFWGSVSCSRTLQHAAKLRPRGARIPASDLPITSNLLYPLSYSRPKSENLTWAIQQTGNSTVYSKIYIVLQL